MAFNYIVHAKYLLIKEDNLKLEALYDERRQLFSRFNNLLGYLHFYIMNAAAQYKLYGMAKAKQVMRLALKIGRADGIILPFIEYDNHILDILKALHEEDRNDGLERLVKETSRYSSNFSLYNDKKSEVNTLTERERKILRLIVTGQTNRKIAASLYVAEITVKKYVIEFETPSAISENLCAL